jgi:hypothetical protein
MNACHAFVVAFAAGLLATSASSAAETEKPDPSFRIVNASGLSITHISVAEHGSPSGSTDLLAGEPLATGQAAAIRLAQTECAWDVTVIYSTPSGDVSEMVGGVDTCALRDLVLAGPPSRPTSGPPARTPPPGPGLDHV